MSGQSSQPTCAVSSAAARNPCVSAGPLGGSAWGPISVQESLSLGAVPSAFACNPSGSASPLGGCPLGSRPEPCSQPPCAVSSAAARNPGSSPVRSSPAAPPLGPQDLPKRSVGFSPHPSGCYPRAVVPEAASVPAESTAALPLEPQSPPKPSVGFSPRLPVCCPRALLPETACLPAESLPVSSFCSGPQPGGMTDLEPASVEPQYDPECSLGFSPSSLVGYPKALVQESARPSDDAVPGAFACNPVERLHGARSFEEPLGREPVVKKPHASSPEAASFARTYGLAQAAASTTNPPQQARSEANCPFGSSASSGPKAAPGSKASTFSPAELWTEFFSCLGSAKTSFSSFWHSIRSLPRPERGPLGRVWPMPVPFPSLHRLRANRRQADAARKLGLNALVLVLSWLSLSCPATAPPYLGLGAGLSRSQWAAVKRLSVNVSSWNRAPQVDWTAMGRSAAKVENAEESMHELAEQARAMLDHSSHWGLGDSSRILASAALPLDPGRISFTGVPEFDPRPFLGPENRRRFEHPLTYAAQQEPLKPVPRVRVHCKPEHVRGFLELLDSGLRLELLPLREVDLSRACGVFAVAKDGDRDRMVLDARPGNAYEDPENPWVRSLAAVEQLRYVFLEDFEEIRVHSEDIRDCYHCFSVGPERARRNAFARVPGPESYAA